LLTTAFRVKPYQISGPSWMSEQRFDILAKIPEGGSTDQVPEMLQALLAERFGLKYHRESKEHEMYGLVVGKNGPKLKESPPEPEPPAAESAAGAPSGPGGAGADKSSQGGRGGMTIAAGDQNLSITPNPAARGMTVSGGRNGTINMRMGTDGTMHLEVAKMSMEELAAALTSFVDRPVEDRTGLKGNYQVTLDFSMGDLLNAARAAGLAVPPGALGTASGAASAAAPADAASTPGDTSVFAAIQQLGLRLEPRKDQVDVVVIDHLEKTPTEN
jgi:uncharacterized protein (TIGR03435 family)